MAFPRDIAVNRHYHFFWIFCESCVCCVDCIGTVIANLTRALVKKLHRSSEKLKKWLLWITISAS